MKTELTFANADEETQINCYVAAIRAARESARKVALPALAEILMPAIEAAFNEGFELGAQAVLSNEFNDALQVAFEAHQRKLLAKR